MSDPVKEQLSAFVDGELPEAEAQLLLKRLDSDPELTRLAAHYELIGSVLRRERVVDAGFAARVHSDVAAEQSHDAPAWRASAGGGFAWRRLAAGGTIAAGVALVAVMGLRTTGGPGPDTGDATVADNDVGTQQPVSPESEIYTVPGVVTAPGQVNVRYESQLVNYMLRHSRTATGLGRSDMGARVISSGLVSEPAAGDNDDGNEEGRDNDAR
ncbi:MAG: RseA family anti-sigma factor [Pseudomonadota bacterium]